MSAPLIYLILGPAGSGRRAVVADLVENGLQEDERALLLTSEDEAAPDAEVEEHLGRLSSLTRRKWQAHAEGGLSATVDPEHTHVFLLADGRSDPLDQVERVREWLSAVSATMARVITVVDSTLGHAHPELRKWYDACIHFSDVVLLNRRGGVPNTWVNDFSARLRKAHFPCLVELVKKDGVQNPALILEPQARRISTIFDPAEAWADLEDEEEEEGEIVANEIGGMGREDPYLEKNASGKRTKELPDIRKYLGGS